MVCEIEDKAAVTEAITQNHRFTAGDRINWQREPRGGYGYGQVIAGVVARVGRKRVQIRVARKAACGWTVEPRWVAAANLSLRTSHVPAVDDQPGE
jgi:hypothetical protein